MNVINNISNVMRILIGLLISTITVVVFLREDPQLVGLIIVFFILISFLLIFSDIIVGYRYPKIRNFAFVGIGIILGLLIGFLLTKPNRDLIYIIIYKPTPTPTATLTNTNTPTPTITPTPFADLDIIEVTWKNVCGGSVTNISEGFDFWLLVEQNNTYHPQTGGPIIVNEAGEFESICLIGISPTQNIGDELTVYAVLVDPQGSQIFTNYLDTAKQNGFPGYKRDELPQSHIIIGSMTVRRKDG